MYFKNLSTMITAVRILKAADAYIDGNITWDDTPVTGTECALYFCTNVYKSRVVQGELEEEIIASWYERDSSSYGFSINGSVEDLEYLNKWDEWNNHSLYAGHGDEQRYDLTLSIPQEDLSRFGLLADARTKFHLTHRAVASTVRFVNEEVFSELMVWPIRGDAGANGVSPMVQAFNQSTNISASFERAAESITNWMRDISNMTQVGTAQEWAVRIHVEWAYIVAPLATFILGLNFCLFSFSETRKLGLQPWKSDVVGMLTHSIDAETRAQLRHAYRHGDLDKAAKAMVVALEDAGNGLELKAKRD
ncbi:hypothetical protein O1611_g1474 [Lasiodiplodia mahajangana]|uniref:Uncharacterized protein n=1 Tax=Lasiodiplodia mahajangana TaxID=1108764 RepID=A0ACC2JXV4_9PEZI|nr:hypothetical protein O1611_g1474 [Lasiodiplodia mahajangana]